MELLINKNKKILSVQKEFQERFPFLKIEFYDSPHAEGEGSEKKNTLDSSGTLEESSKKFSEGNLHISPIMTATELEQAFEEKFGLSVQVFRKSGNIWLQTITTDELTLTELNQKGKDGYDQPENTIIDSMDRQELE